ncbi:hypothetical protein CYMTET_54374 [Cymbomonas tetramitiformis]|uniref:Uncharacterized protein n=1 Tax=Cymbomonas tetramitiformis TaxID=36881 RepID=A0AAE0BF14_9CHLO|nr:hypothetical protein CYMTET_54374 [Cymbomonas tetramitiformis]
MASGSSPDPTGSGCEPPSGVLSLTPLKLVIDLVASKSRIVACRALSLLGCLGARGALPPSELLQPALMAGRMLRAYTTLGIMQWSPYFFVLKDTCLYQFEVSTKWSKVCLCSI